jgi:hypothetical protein
MGFAPFPVDQIVAKSNQPIPAIEKVFFSERFVRRGGR